MRDGSAHRQAGTTRQTFYQHFASKAQLVGELIRQVDAVLTGADEPPPATVVERASGRW